MNSSIVIISSGQPSANPRMVKEAIALSAVGFKIKVLYCPLSPWADEFDKKIFRMYHEIDWVKVGYHPVNEKWAYFFSRIRQKFFQYLYSFVGDRFDTAIKSQVLYSQELIKQAKINKADLYIGHNLGALPAVVIAAKKHKALAVFDFEDFHRGEDVIDSLHWEKTVLTEKKYVPFLSHATTASQLITSHYATIFPILPVTTINNCFPLINAVKEVKPLIAKPLKLFWFSQTIGEKRGLEMVIEAMGNIEKGAIELSLLGNCTSKTKNYFESLLNKAGLNKEQLKFFPAVEENEIFNIAAMHHIGLACEVPHILNRDICLTNKIFIYLISGNAILFSNTKAQSSFVSENSGIGAIYDQNNKKQLTAFLRHYIDDPALLHLQRTKSLLLGTKRLNWEKEQQVLIETIKRLLKEV